MKYHTTQSGYSLVEVLVSISVLLIATVGPMAIATQGIKSSQFALEQNTAYFLAQEGIEIIFAIRNNYALEDIDDGLGSGDPDTSWDWISWPGSSGIVAGVSVCPSVAAGSPCHMGVSFSDSGFVLRNCNGGNANNCKIYFDESDGRAVYSHESSGGTETPFRRVVTLTRESADSVKVESSVTWESSVFGSTREVESVTYLFDSNYE